MGAKRKKEQGRNQQTAKARNGPTVCSGQIRRGPVPSASFAILRAAAARVKRSGS